MTKKKKHPQGVEQFADSHNTQANATPQEQCTTTGECGILDFGFYLMDCMDGMKRFPDKYFELAIVDPPYGGVGRGGYMYNKAGGGKGRHPNNYVLDLWKQEAPSVDYFNELFRVSQNQIIWGGNYFVEQIAKNSQCWLVWDKQRGDGIGFADVELAWTSFNVGSRIFRFKWNGMLQEDMKNKEVRIHPTQKPVALYNWCLGRFAKPGDKILDTHVGSASSLIACHDLGFKYVGFEISEKYYEMAKERLDAYKAQLSLFDGGWFDV